MGYTPFSGDGTGLSQHAPKNDEYRAVGSPEIQLPDLLACQEQGCAEFSMRAFECAHVRSSVRPIE